MGDNEEKPKLSLEKGESVYSFAIFLPPIIHHRRGSLWNYEMFLGIVLLILNVAMQVGLTYVVGQGVLVEGQKWRETLVEVQVDDQVAQGQVTTDASQEVSFLSAASMAWQADPDPLNHIVEEVEMEAGLHNTNEHLLLAEIQELESKLEEEEASVQDLKIKSRKRKQSSLALRALSTPAKTAAQSTDHAVNLAVADKPIGKAPSGKPKAGARTFCQMKNATYTCFPPSAKYAAQWEQLDTNGDGIWSREEAEKDEAGLEKKFNAKAYLVFRAITVGLVDRQTVDKRLWVSPQVEKMEGIPKAYFDYWMGDAALCSYADPGMCPSLLARGFFH
jgi:hypothetical protein